MNRKTPFFCIFLTFFLTFFCYQNSLFSQIITKSYTVPKFIINKYEDHDKVVRLTFDDASTTAKYPSLPAVWDKVQVNHLYTSYNFTLFNAKYEPLTQEEIAIVSLEEIMTDPHLEIKTASDAGKLYALLRLLPIIKNSSGQYQRLVSCDIRFEGINPVAATKSSQLKNSVLATGTWYKIAVSNTGLHKVSYSDLVALGIPVSNLRSSSISLFGNGGGQIPDINPVIQIDDLYECQIMVVDNGNDLFDENSYFIFYAQGPHSWDYDLGKNTFSHNYNIYSDNAYYFINVDFGIGEKKRISKKNFLSQTANKEISYFTHYDFYEKDVKNFGESGRDWFDDPLYPNSTKTCTFTLPELYKDSARVKVRVASTNTSGASIGLTCGSVSKIFYLLANSQFARITNFNEEIPFSSGNVSVSLKYNSNQPSSAAYLDYVEIQTKCKLKITNNAMPFAITENIGASNISLIKMANASAQTKIWDVTDHNGVYEVEGNLSGSQFSFHTPTNVMRKFVAFNGASYHSVVAVGRIDNQNLHGFRNVDMVIVSHPNFLSEANRLATFRENLNNITVKVVTPAQVYNEFSSGAQDIVAIRNFMRYLYDNDGQQIKYLLLFGRPSYDYRGRAAGTRMFVPNYQQEDKGSPILSENDFRSCDDFFGILGFGSGSLSISLVNVAVGRFPVSTTAQAKIAVDKTINASVRYRVTQQNASQVSNLGDWRNIVALIADDKDSNIHFRDAENAAEMTESNSPFINIDKIYCDAYKQVSYAGGQRYPDVNKAIKTRLERGCLLMAYFGHGSGNGMAHERIMEINDIYSYRNMYNQPLIITLACSFGCYDQPAISPAELLFLSDKGGASSLFTTSRVSYSGNEYGKRVFSEFGSKWDGNRYKTIGEIHRLAKNNTGGTNGFSNMIYMIGDPSMLINIPFHNVSTTEILDENRQKCDTLKALSKVTVKGRITDDVGATLSNFNGNIYPSIFDKAIQQKTLGQGSEVVEFFQQKNILFKGNATVTNGEFEFSFYVPKDINFDYGKGKISYYAASANDDAGSYFDNFIIGGINNNFLADDKGPEIEIFLNDEKFVPGGITNPDPILILKLKDEYGINTTGNGIGHDLIAILDNNVERQIVLNDFYLSNQDSYNSGTVRYQLEKLTPGTHTIKVRAWDICNNPSEASIDFVVKTDKKLEIEHVLNYPNPFTTKTSFFFEHNQPTETFDILIHIFTISGKLVKTLTDKQFLEGNRSNPIEWNGRDDYGDKIGKGVYLYRLKVRNSRGEMVEKIEKIAIL